MARERFRRDIAVLNFYYDTPIITGITLELRTSVFDMISAVGGTLGLFTGISVIAFALVDPESVKNTVKSTVSFYAFGIYERKNCT